MALYQKLEPLSHASHGGLKLRATDSYGFARDCLAVPIGMHELGSVAREYPIIFPENSELPAALLGVEPGCNAYVSVEGIWLADYVPEVVRCYPFAARPRKAPVGRNEASGKTESQVIMLDAGSEFISADEGQPIFTDDRKIVPALAGRLTGLRRFARSAEAARTATVAIKAADILVERPVRIVGADAKSYNVQGLHTIDETKFNALPAKTFTALRKAGALPLVYAQMLSWLSFKHGAIGRSHPKAD